MTLVPDPVPCPCSPPLLAFKFLKAKRGGVPPPAGSHVLHHSVVPPRVPPGYRPGTASVPSNRIPRFVTFWSPASGTARVPPGYRPGTARVPLTGSHVLQHSVVLPGYRPGIASVQPPQDPTFCSILWSRLRYRPSTARLPSGYRPGTAHKIPCFVAFCGPALGTAQVQPRYRLGTASPRSNVLHDSVVPPRVWPWVPPGYRLGTARVPPTGSYVLQHSVVPPPYRLPCFAAFCGLPVSLWRRRSQD